LCQTLSDSDVTVLVCEDTAQERLLLFGTNFHITLRHVILVGPAFAHGTTGAKRTVGAKKCEALQYCGRNEFIKLTVGTSRVLMSKAATNNICSNKRKA
jgi:hypothetical protein